MKSFISQCIKDLKEIKICYVYKPEHIEELKKKFKGEITYEENECGYTIKVIKKVEKK